jgi:hypothetical protein
MRNILIILSILLFACNSSTEQNESVGSIGKSDSSNISTLSSNGKNSELDVEFGIKFYHSTIAGIEDTLLLKTPTENLEITPSGILIINNKQRIQLTNDLTVERAFCYQDSLSWYIFFEETDMDYSGSNLKKISKKNFKTIFTTPINGFNLGRPLIKNDQTYVSAIGFIGKIDLKTGEYKWKIDDLYDSEKYSFNSFDTIILNKETVEFHSKHSLTKQFDKIIVGIENGKIIEIKK